MEANVNQHQQHPTPHKDLIKAIIPRQAEVSSANQRGSYTSRTNQGFVMEQEDSESQNLIAFQV